VTELVITSCPIGSAKSLTRQTSPVHALPPPSRTSTSSSSSLSSMYYSHGIQF
jgi:hypothetical protein